MRSIRSTLLGSILGALLLVLAVAGVAIFLVARGGLRDQLDESLLARARTFATLVTDEDDALEFEFDGPLREPDLGVFVRITDDAGNVVAVAEDWPHDAPLGSSPADVAIGPETTARGVALRAHPLLETDGVIVSTSARTVTVEVIGRTDGVRRAMASLLTALLAGGLLAAAGTALAVGVGVRRGLTPLRRLGRALECIDSNAPAAPTLEGPLPAELRPIIFTLDTLLERIGDAMRRERRFTDAAAHELRTPIAELRTIADVADRFPEPERLHHAVNEARTIADEMEGLLESLLATARGVRGGPCAAVPVLPLARSVAADRLEPLAARGVSCAFDGDESAAWVVPDAAAVAILRNLVENASEYTPDGGTVRISVETVAGGAMLHVENGPVTLDGDQLDQLFEPFWRADAARTDRRHRGLGLSIVAALCDAFGLERLATLTPHGDLRLSVGAAGDLPRPA